MSILSSLVRSPSLRWFIFLAFVILSATCFLYFFFLFPYLQVLCKHSHLQTSQPYDLSCALQLTKSKSCDSPSPEPPTLPLEHSSSDLITPYLSKRAGEKQKETICGRSVEAKLTTYYSEKGLQGHPIWWMSHGGQSCLSFRVLCCSGWDHHWLPKPETQGSPLPLHFDLQ
jgi:hypothetical protein